MRFLFLILTIYTLLLTSCAPIPVRYSNVFKAKENEQILNNRQQKITFKVLQNHFPDKRVKNSIYVELRNNSRDTIYFNGKYLFRLVTKVNSIDTMQWNYNTSFERNSKIKLSPFENLVLSKEYWSNNLGLSFKKFQEAIENDEIKLIVEFRTQENVHKDTISLLPNFSKKSD